MYPLNALRDYRKLHPEALFAPELRSTVVISDFALRNQALFRGQWLGESPGVATEIERTNAESWSHFWNHCLWF